MERPEPNVGDIKTLLQRLASYDGNNGFTYIGQKRENSKLSDYLIVPTKDLVSNNYKRYKQEAIRIWLLSGRIEGEVQIEQYSAYHEFRPQDWDEMAKIIRENIISNLRKNR